MRNIYLSWAVASSCIVMDIFVIMYTWDYGRSLAVTHSWAPAETAGNIDDRSKQFNPIDATFNNDFKIPLSAYRHSSMSLWNDNGPKRGTQVCHQYLPTIKGGKKYFKKWIISQNYTSDQRISASSPQVAGKWHYCVNCNDL